MIDTVFTRFSEQIAGKFDERLRECCLIWGVDVNNHKEIGRRCKIVNRDWSDLKEVHIDDNVVMYFTDWKIEQKNIDKPFTVNASFRCSEIIKPKK